MLKGWDALGFHDYWCLGLSVRRSVLIVQHFRLLGRGLHECLDQSAGPSE